MSTAKARVTQKGRILYVEPNTVFGDVNGVPVTPDYSDLCISFNLIVEVMSRFKQTAKIGENESGKFNIFWTSKLGLDQSKPWVSFLSGEDYGDNQFLTTYYTDTHYEDILKKNIVEGLGIENITVAFENYYTPTVSIKFVDQRGSSLFGREEATHYNDKLTIDNIFGAFFTAPYPKFKLQIKGFYGKPVTLQLTCSGFKGSLNSETGNFEATATFIGYSYSLLTDIPFQYIVAAPYCDYAGREYWDNKKTSPEWALFKSGGEPMQRIHDFVNSINAAFSDQELYDILSQEDNETLEASETEKASLNSLYAVYARFLQELVEVSQANAIKNYDNANQALENEQILLLTNQEVISTGGVINDAFIKLSEELDDYNESYPSNTISKQLLPNRWMNNFPNIRCIDLFDITEDEETGVRVVRCKDPNCDVITVENLCKIEFGTKSDGSGDSRKMMPNTAKILLDYLNQDVSNNIQRYACLIDLYDFRKRINDRLKEIDNEVSKIERQTERDYIKLAQAKLKMVPYIGNIFKMIMAHIETLVYMMYKCYENIKADEAKGNRSPAHLRVNITSTDVLPNNTTAVPAWPMVTRASSNNNENKSLEDENTIGWVGDFSPYFEEEKLVKALFLACKKTQAPEINYQEENSNVRYVPIMPSDVNDVRNVFNAALGNKSISHLAGALGLRSAQLFGIMERGSVTKEIAETAGRMDAYNYYLMAASKSSIKEKIIDVAGNESLSDKLYKVMLCDPNVDNLGSLQESTGVQVHPFETCKGIMSDKISNKRHPIYYPSGGNLTYVHYYTKSRNGLVPSIIKDFDGYGSMFEYDNEGSKTYFDFTATENENATLVRDILHNCNAKTLFRDRENGATRCMNYLNYDKFNVITNPPVVSGIIKRYNELKTGTFKILGEKYEENFDKILERYWYLDEASYAKFFTDKRTVLRERLTPEALSEIAKSTKLVSSGGFIDALNKKYDKKPTRSDSDDSWSYNGQTHSIDDFTIPLIKISYGKEHYAEDGKKAVSMYYTSLFGSYFYYLQNDAETEIKEKNKCLLFLHSMTQGHISSYRKLNAFAKDKKHGSIQHIPYAYALLLGGLLWRIRYAGEHGGKDPIIYSGKKKVIRTVNDFDVAPLSFVTPETSSGTPSLNPLFHKTGTGVYFFYADTSVKKYYNVSLSELFSGDKMADFRHPDYHIQNALIKTFEEFVGNEWKTIKEGCELYPAEGNFEFDTKYLSNIMFSFNNCFDGKETAERYFEKINTYFQKTVKDYEKRYSLIIDGENGDIDSLFCYLNGSNALVQKILRHVYASKVIIVDTSNSNTTETRKRTELEPVQSVGDVIVAPSTLKSYLDGFSTTLKKIVESSSEITVEDDVDAGESNDEDAAEFTRDVAIPIYLYLKMLWDKWLAGSTSNADDHEYTVKNFFNNFIFIDSFYRNIESRLMMNCQTFLEVYDNNTFSNEDSSVFKIIGDLTTHHHCMFLAIPDFIDNMASEDPKKAIEALESIFTPVPYSEIGEMRRNNRFVIIYVPKLSENPSELNNYKEDGFNIWSYNDARTMDDPNIPDEYKKTLADNDRDFPPILKKNKSDFTDGEDISRYGYFVPSFGLAYGYQHNHLFKRVNLNMETPVITSAVINTLSHIAKQGSGNEHKIAFIGQDLYPVFSNYSYICEFEMMGCAQIQPLMYFQLMNVPMWRGTYMIFNVTHTMTPGNMVTKVRAMKLSNRAIPYSNAWFTKNLAYKDDVSDGSANGCEIENNTTGDNGGTMNTNSSGDTSYDYSKYAHLVKKKKHVNMEAVLKGVTTLDSGTLGKGYRLGYNNYRGCCTAGPSTWYGRGGISLRFWCDTGSPYSTMRADTWMTEQGFKRVYQSGAVDVSGRENSYPIQKRYGSWSGLEPGDIMIIFGRHQPKSAHPLTAHAAMWTGKDWRSDCVQASPACEYGLRKPSEGGSIQIWRFDDATYEKYH